MKSLKLYITKGLHINRNTKENYHNYHPKTNDDLQELVNKLIKERGNKADLNDIDTSEIIDMKDLFVYSDFNGDISGWDVSNVTNMCSMFAYSKFNGDIEILFLEAGHYGRIVVVPSARPAYVAAPLLKVTQFAVFFASSGREEYRRYIFGIWL